MHNETKKILICGDSFSADWTMKYSGRGWPNMLAESCRVVNLSQAGCGQYKILKQIERANLTEFDVAIISHTSPTRLHTCHHPAHANDSLHDQCDFIYTDVVEQSKSHPNLRCVVDFFENYFDIEHAKSIHALLCQEIDRLLHQFNGMVINMVHIDWHDLYQFENLVDYSKLFELNRGFINHYNDTGNNQIYQDLLKKIQSGNTHDNLCVRG